MLSKSFSSLYNGCYIVWKGFVSLLAIQKATGSHFSNFGASIDSTATCPRVEKTDAASRNFCLDTSWIHSQLGVEEEPPANYFSQDEQVQEHYPSALLVKQLQKIKINKVIGSADNYTIVEPTKIEKNSIKKALNVTNNEETLNLLLKEDVIINIVSEEYMTALTNTSDLSFCFLQTPYNSILLNEHLFKDGAVNEEQLLTGIANEVSHATIHNHHPEKYTNTNNEIQYKTLVPWVDDKTREKFLEAYNSYKANVKEYKRLIKKSKKNKGKEMTPDEKINLQKYDNAIKDYITPSYGSEGYNAMQVHFIERKNNLEMYKDLKNTIPPLDKTQERLDYLRKNFFYELENKRILNKYFHENELSIYNNDDNQLQADLISDFESLPPSMRNTFGESLCTFLSDYFGTDNHCNRPNWPSQ